MLLFENISMAVSGLLANKMRALLTMRGIILGIGSVIGIMTVGDSLQSSVTESMQSMGANNITVSVTTKDEDDETDGGLTRLFMPSDPSDEDLLTDEMIADYRTAFGDEVYAVSLTESVGSYTAESGGESAPVSVTGVNNEYRNAEDLELMRGRFFTDEDAEKGRKVAVTGTVSARAYTGNDGGVRASLEVTAEAVEFLSSPRHNSDGEGFTEVDDAELPEGFR